METLIEAIESNDLTKVKEFLSTNRQVMQGMELCNVVGLVHDAQMLNTIFNLSGEYFRYYFKEHQQHIFFKAIKDVKDATIIEVILNLDKDFVKRLSSGGSGLTPLMEAVSFNCDASVAKLLLEYNANVNFCDKYGRTPLHVANNSKVVKLLIEYGARINCTNNNGYTPLMSAAVRRNNETILEFIKNGADLEVRNCEGKTCLHLALEYKCDVDIINLICSKTLAYNVEDNHGLTPLCYALKCFYNKTSSAESYQAEFIQKLINKGFDVNTNVLMYALKHCVNVDLIIGLEKKFDIRSVDEDGNCVLHHARDARLISWFVRRGLPINHENNKGITPLMNAIIRGDKDEVIESLLFWGSDIRKLDNFFPSIEHEEGLFTRNSFYDLLVLYGMSVSLKSNFIKGLLSPMLNRIAQDGTLFYMHYRCLEGHIFLSNENVTIPEDTLLNVNVSHLVQTFSTELNKMKHEIFTENVSYYNFCMKQYRSIRSPFLDKEFTKADRKNLKKLFPNLYKEVIVKIKINIRVCKRKASIRKLMDVCISKQRERENIQDPSCERVTFDNDAMEIVASYLTDREINCLLAAAIID